MDASIEERIADLKWRFNADTRYGLAKSPNKSGFLLIARAGHKVWNNWIETFGATTATFTEHDFRGSPIDFSEFLFPKGATFAGAIFDVKTRLLGAIFQEKTDFSNAVFVGNSDFSNMEFESDVNFSGASFLGSVSFAECRFRNEVDFGNARFVKYSIHDRLKLKLQNDLDLDKEFLLVDFRNANFHGTVSFQNAEIGCPAVFEDSTFTVRADFEAAIFEKPTSFDRSKFVSDVIFNKSKFESSAKFSNTNFSGPTRFVNTAFRGPVAFSDAVFSGDVRFDKAVFGETSDFDNTVFSESASFREAHFSDHTNFSGATFKDSADFYFTALASNAKFKTCRFHTEVNFRGAQFGDFLDFSNSSFAGEADFHASVFGDQSTFRRAKFENRADFSASIRHDAAKGSAEFQAIYFNGSHFHGEADFEGRQFKSTTDFGPDSPPRHETKRSRTTGSSQKTEFHGIPNFHGCKFHQDTRFDSARFEAPLSTDAARAYRTLKLAMELLKSTREEQKFFRLEMRAEHPGLPPGQRWISTLYSALSDYGFSLKRPAFALILITIIIGALHGALADGGIFPTHWFGESNVDWNRTSQWFRYVLIDMIPVPGMEKTQIELRDILFKDYGWKPTGAIALEMIHKIIALGCVFLLGLALRNLFKMKS